MVGCITEHARLVARNTGLRERDALLLRLTFSDAVAESDVVRLLDGCDILAESFHFNLLLAQLANRLPPEWLPREHHPRLQGVVKYIHFNNITQFSGFRSVGAELNRRGIPILLMKGIAFKMMRPDAARPMFDIDFAVPDERFGEAVQMAYDVGFQLKLREPHSVDLVMETKALDIHRRLTKGGGGAESHSGIWQRATAVDAFGVTALLPTPEDMLFITLANAAFNLRRPADNPPALLMWFFDSIRLVRDNPALRWGLVVDDANRTDCSYDVRVLLKVVESVSPGLFPSGFVDGLGFTDQGRSEMDVRLKMGLLAENIDSLKASRKQIAARKFSSPGSFAEWLGVWLKYRFARVVKNNAVARRVFLDDMTTPKANCFRRSK